MIIPWQLTEQNRYLVLTELATFEAQTFVYRGEVSHLSGARALSHVMRRDIMEQIQRPLDPESSIWIASGRHGKLYSLLHAVLDGQREARIDLLCAVPWEYNRHARVYEGCGEFLLLVLLLEQRGVTSFHTRLPLDAKHTGIPERWSELERGKYVHLSGDVSSTSH